uniref:FAD dependent oxidoreductase domain-containing protein n=1 Tax=Octopus bimaculoides TaxID=37653 RepID=A0A0L8FLX1_OCTBM
MWLDVDILDTKVGLRPFREQTRLDQETITFNGRSIQVINNYGHGGCGLTTFVGCAKDVVAMIREAGAAPWYSAKL